MNNAKKSDNVISFALAKHKAEKDQYEKILEPAKDYCINYRIVPLLKRLDSKNLDKVLGYAEALVYVQNNEADKTAFEALAHSKEKNAVDLKKIEDVRTCIYKAKKAVRASGKRLDYIRSFIRQVFWIAEEILRSEDFEVLDIHTVRMSRSAISRIKELRNKAELIDAVCDGKGIINSWRAHDVPARLVEVTSSMVLQILDVDVT